MLIWISWAVYLVFLATALIFKDWKLTAATLAGSAYHAKTPSDRKQG